MAKSPQTQDINTDLLQKLLIIELAKAGVTQANIGKIVGVATAKVNSILKHFKTSK